ncbi:hypothetical protein L0Y59_01875, partial [Candidatus Uhrbacteria bacterium]|nr:hypothetical protein [Candidatus Uhrbacteria bacterium]
MSEFYLDLSDAPRVVDFLAMASAYAGKKHRSEADRLVKAYQEGQDVPLQELADAARHLALATWPARRAVRDYVTHEGTEEEWRRVTAAVRPSTRLLMNR